MTLLGARWVALSTLLSFFFSMLPFVAPYFAVVPSALDLYYRSTTAAPALVLAISHVLVYWFVDPLIYAEISGAHPYFIALSVVGGLYMMGAAGIVMGPLLLIIVQQLSWYVFDNVESSSSSSPVAAVAAATVAGGHGYMRELTTTTPTRHMRGSQ